MLINSNFPGVGKTTLIKKLINILIEKGIKTSGFYTEEVRKSRVREGFDVVTLDGKRGRLARDQSLLQGPVKYKVGKYSVLIQDFETIALPSLSKVGSCKHKSNLSVPNVIIECMLLQRNASNLMLSQIS